MATELPNQPLHLSRSAPAQKVEAKPSAHRRRECSQGGAVMPRLEVARLPSLAGSPVGRLGGRVSSLRTKSVLPASQMAVRAAAHAVSGALIQPVQHAIMPDTRNMHLTDEVPRRPVPSGRVSRPYKSCTKGGCNASAAGTVSPRPRLQGCPQRQSRGPVRGRSCRCRRLERQNLRVPSRASRFMGTVSPQPEASQWPGRTSFCQHGGPLRNIPKQPPLARPAVASP